MTIVLNWGCRVGLCEGRQKGRELGRREKGEGGGGVPSWGKVREGRLPFNER